MVNKPLSMIATAILALLSVGQNVLAQESFFKGKNIRIVVASTAGGGFDAYTRMLSRYLGKYIPGNPLDSRGEYAGSGPPHWCQPHL